MKSGFYGLPEVGGGGVAAGGLVVEGGEDNAVESAGERVRLVTHLDVPAAAIPEAAARLRRARARIGG